MKNIGIGQTLLPEQMKAIVGGEGSQACEVTMECQGAFSISCQGYTNNEGISPCSKTKGKIWNSVQCVGANGQMIEKACVGPQAPSSTLEPPV